MFTPAMTTNLKRHLLALSVPMYAFAHDYMPRRTELLVHLLFGEFTCHLQNDKVRSDNVRYLCVNTSSTGEFFKAGDDLLLCLV